MPSYGAGRRVVQRVAQRALAFDHTSTQLPRGVPPLRVLHHSPGICVVHKPVGLAAQGGQDHARLDLGEPTLEQHFYELAQRLAPPSPPSPSHDAAAEVEALEDLELEPKRKHHGIRAMHRLDKDVEGPMILALTRPKAKELARQFCSHEIVKTYYALISRYLDPSERPAPLPVEQQLSRPVTTYTTVDASGRVSPHRGPATPPPPPSRYPISPSPDHVFENLTSYAFLGGSASLGLSLIRLHPHSGRKHQLRVFCAEKLKAPVVGDWLYGYKSRPALQAADDADTVRPPPPAPSAQTPVFLKCTAVKLTTHSPSGRSKPILVRAHEEGNVREAGWAGVREWLDDWVGEPEETPATLKAGKMFESFSEEEIEQRERQRVLKRRQQRKEERKAARRSHGDGLQSR